MVFAPWAVGGIGLQHLHYEMETQQILLLLRHLHAGTTLGKDITILIHTYQLWAGLSAGLSTSVLSDTRPCSWVPDCWLSRIHRTLSEHRIQIHHDIWTVSLIRQHDTHIMEAVMELNLKPAQLRQINACQMYLQVTTLAEITDHTGTQLLPQAILMKGQETPTGLHDISTSLLDWPAIHLPALMCWKLWTCTICLIFTGDPHGIRLHTPLSPWHSHYQVHQFWQWQMSPSGSLLHQQNSTSTT